MAEKRKQTLLSSFFFKKQKLEKEVEIEKTDCLDFDEVSDVPNSFAVGVPSSSADASNNYKRKQVGKVGFNKSWLMQYEWLYVDETRGGAFCKYCEVFMKNDLNVLQKTGGVFISQPFTNYRKATGKTGKLEKHVNAEHHARSLSMEKMRLQNVKKPIHAILNTENEKQISDNRQSLSALIEGLYFLAKEEIPHTTKYEPLARKLLLKNNVALNNWVLNQSNRSTYISKATGSEFLSCIGDILDSRDSKKLNNKHFSLMADESTNINNITELTILMRYVDEDKLIKDVFLCLVELNNTDASTITETIVNELSKRNINLNRIIACAFDGAATFSGNISGVRQRLSDKVQREIPYVHCRAHILALALTSARNKYPYVKRVLHVIKDIYKLFHKSSKRERMLHDVQAVLEEPILKIPESIDVRWLSNYKSVHAVRICYVAIMMTCEHIHKDGADLASLAGGILLDMEKSSFLLTLCVLDEALFAVSNLSKTLQKESLSISSLPVLISATFNHLENIASQCVVFEKKNELYQNCERLIEKACTSRRIIEDEPKITTMKSAKKFVDSMIDQMKTRFNDKAVSLICLSSKFESVEAFNTLTIDDISKLCPYLNIDDTEGVWADIRSFKYVLNAAEQNNRSITNIISYVLDSNIGYENLKDLCTRLWCIPVSTASAERSFSTMNRICTKLRNRMGQETLNACMKISIEGPEELSSDLIEEVIDLYARQKQRRIRLLK